MLRSPRLPAEREVGAAVVDFVLVAVILIPVVVGLLQVGLTLYVRNTIAAAASEGARYAAALGRVPEDGVARARAQVAGVLGQGSVRGVTASETVRAGLRVVEVRVVAVVGPLGLGGPGIELSATGHGVREEAP